MTPNHYTQENWLIAALIHLKVKDSCFFCNVNILFGLELHFCEPTIEGFEADLINRRKMAERSVEDCRGLKKNI